MKSLSLQRVFLTFLLFKKVRLLFFFALLAWFILLLKEFSFLKLFVFWVVVLFKINYNFLRRLSHLIFYIIYIYFYLFNLFNIGCLSFYQDNLLVSILFMEDFVNLQHLTGCICRLFNFNFKLLLYKITVVHFQTKLVFFIVSLCNISSSSYF